MVSVSSLGLREIDVTLEGGKQAPAEQKTGDDVCDPVHTGQQTPDDHDEYQDDEDSPDSLPGLV